MPPRRDYTGQKFGRIILESPIAGRPGYWRGRCDCSAEVEKRIDNLRRPGDHSCGRCGNPTPCLTEDSIREKFATVAEHLDALAREVTRLHDAIIRNSSPAPDSPRQSITSREGQALWSHIDELKSWLKQEIGARLRGLDERTIHLQKQFDEFANIREALMQQAQEIAAVRHTLAVLESQPGTYRHQEQVGDSSPDEQFVIDVTDAEQAGRAEQLCLAHANSNGRSKEQYLSLTSLASTPSLSRPGPWTDPFPPMHSLHERYRYRVSTEGYEVEHQDGKAMFLGFADSITEVQTIIKDDLYENGYTESFIEQLFDQADK